MSKKYSVQPTSFKSLPNLDFAVFKYYPFMCINQPFYFDKQDKLNNITQQIYRFRSYIVDFYKERKQGFKTINFNLGLKQSLNLSDFFIKFMNKLYSIVPFSKEYNYIISNNLSPKSFKHRLRKDRFYSSITNTKFSILLLQSLFYQKQGRF